MLNLQPYSVTIVSMVRSGVVTDGLWAVVEPVLSFGEGCRERPWTLIRRRGIASRYGELDITYLEGVILATIVLNHRLRI